MYGHDLRSAANGCGGCFRWMQHELEGDLGPEARARFAKVLEIGIHHATALNRFVQTLSIVGAHDTVSGILSALADLLGPGVNVVVTPEAEGMAIPNDDMGPLLWMLVESQIRSNRTGSGEVAETKALVRVDVDEHAHGRIVVGPDDQQRGPEWKDVTEEACDGGWLGAAAYAFPARGHEIRVLSNGPRAEVTLRWIRH
jgi:hypothetical protein